MRHRKIILLLGILGVIVLQLQTGIASGSISVADADAVRNFTLNSAPSDALDSTDAPQQETFVDVYVSDADAMRDFNLSTASEDVLDSTDAPEQETFVDVYVSDADAMRDFDLFTASEDALDSTDAPEQGTFIDVYVNGADAMRDFNLSTVSSDALDSTDAPEQETFIDVYVSDADAMRDFRLKPVEPITPENNPPIASFTHSPENPRVGEEITFDASSSTDSDGEIISYEWDFGDENYGTGEVAFHSYSSVGDYTVILTVTDDEGATDSISKTVNIGIEGLLDVPFFSQRDPAWSDKKLDHSPYSIGEYGCALTSAAMVAKYFGYDTDPDRLNTSLTEVGGLDTSGDLHWEKVEEVSNGKVAWIESVEASWSRIDQELSKENPVISSVDCSLGTHFIVFIGKIKDEHYFLDPYDESRTLNKWPNGAHGEYTIENKNLKIYHPNQPPTCAIELQKNGIPVDNINVGEFFDIYVGGSTDDQGIKEVRFSSDESQDGNPTGEWTNWYDWSTSSWDWNAETKIKAWSFATGGNKEVWAEIKDNTDQTSKCSANIYAHPGYAIIVAGQGRWWAWGEKRVFDHCANNAYRVLRNLGFDDGHIIYLNSNRPQDVDENGDDEVNNPASYSYFKKAVNDVKGKMEGNPTPFILYLVGHGDLDDGFVFDKGDLSDEGDLKVLQLQEELSKFSSETPMLIVIGSCYSGSFITSNESISAENRIIITAATADDQKRNPFAWARSSDRFWGNLNKGLNVKDAFITDAWLEWWDLWLDDNGDRRGSPPNNLGEDGNLASATTIGVPGTEDLELASWYSAWIHSVGELRVYDSQNRVTGLVNGEIKEKIPDSIYDEQDEIVAIFSPSDTYRYEVVSTDKGTYGLDIAYIEGAEATTFTATDIPTASGAVHQYVIDWDALSQDEEGVTVQVDSDGDGVFEDTFTADDDLSQDEFIVGTNEPPVADAGPDQTVERSLSDSAGAEVTLDGSGSYDPDEDPITYEWTWDAESTSGVKPTVILPMGTTTVTLNVSDGMLYNTDTVNITVVDTTPPVVSIKVPAPDDALQDGVTLTANASDLSGVTEVYFYVREPGGVDGTGTPIGYEDLVATFNTATDKWEYTFDTTLLPDGYYVILAKAVDFYGNEGWSDVVPFSIRNWAVVELLPASERNKAGRTMPVKFSLRIAEIVDPSQPFVRNEELEIRIYDAADPITILQRSQYGATSRDYRIDNDGELYITNFKTKKQLAEYVVEIWRPNANDFLVGSFTFETMK